MTMTRAAARVSLIGLGSIGRDVYCALAGTDGARLVAAADPAFVGRDAGEVCGLPADGVMVVERAEEALRAGQADVALVLTASGTDELLPTLEAAAAAGIDVVSTCEDLAFAAFATPDLARKIDALARAAGITILGTGVNPGFVMDRLPLQL